MCNNNERNNNERNNTEKAGEWMMRVWAWSIGGSAAIAGLGLGGYALWHARQMAQTHAGTTATAIVTTRASIATSSSNRAPQQLPSAVTQRCGTVYVSFGLWPGQPDTADIAKYVNGGLVAQYPQREPAGSPWFTAGTWSGGVPCAPMIPPQLQIVSADLQGVS